VLQGSHPTEDLTVRVEPKFASLFRIQ